MKRKYILTEETTVFNDVTLYRIKAVRDFGKVKSGDLGGFVENEQQLSHNDNAWVAGDALIIGKSVVYGNGWVGEDAKIFNSEVSGNAKVYGKAQICRGSVVNCFANISGNVTIFSSTLNDCVIC